MFDATVAFLVGQSGKLYSFMLAVIVFLVYKFYTLQALLVHTSAIVSSCQSAVNRVTLLRGRPSRRHVLQVPSIHAFIIHVLIFHASYMQSLKVVDLS